MRDPATGQSLALTHPDLFLDSSIPLLRSRRPDQLETTSKGGSTLSSMKLVCHRSSRPSKWYFILLYNGGSSFTLVLLQLATPIVKMGVTTVDEIAMAAAIAWYKENPRKNSMHQAAKRYGVKRSTLNDRVNGKKSRLRRAQESLLLYPAEELALVEAILGHCDRGFPVRIPQLRSWAFQILRRRLPHARSLGLNWQTRFLHRHPEIHTRWRQNMDRVRVTAANEESLAAFYDLVCCL